MSQPTPRVGAPKTYGAVFTVVLPLTWWQRVRVACGATVAVKVGLQSARYLDKVRVGADVIVGKVEGTEAPKA